MSKTNSLKRLTMLGAMMAAMMAALPTMGQTNYVIMYNSYILGQTAGETTDFIPNASIYTGTSGSTFRNGNGYYIVYAGNNTNVNFSTTEGSNLTISNNHLYYNNYYLRYSGSNHVFQFRNQYNVEANVYEVTTSSHINDFSISGDATIATMGTNSSYSHTNATYYDIYSFNNLTYYSTNPSVAASTTAPTSGLPTLTTGYTWSISANSYATVNTTTGAITVNSLPATDQNVTLTCSATRNGVTQTATKTITLEAPKVDPTGISITSGNTMTAYVGNTSNITYSLTPSPCYNNVTFSSANTGIASVNGSGVVTGVATGTTTITVTALKIDGTTTSALTKTVNVTVKDKVATPVIAFTPTVADAGATATAEITCSTTGTAIYYTVNGSDPTSSSTQYNGTFTVNDGDIVKAIAIKTTDATYWDNSDIASRTYTACSTTAPTITYVQSGSTATVTITAETGATIYYTTNGNDPTESSANGTTTATINSVASGTTVKAFAKNGTCQASAIVSKEIITSGVSGGVVTLYDYEDHNWAYYNKELNLPIRSWNPADVKITYYGNGIVMTGNNDYTASSTDFVQPGNANYVGGAKVNVGGEDENTFVYYKTLERTDGSTSATPTGRCLYTTIPNPFQVRPTYGSRGSTDANDFTGWRGFQCWRLKSVSGGAVYSAASGGTALATGAIINSETDIYFAPSNEYGMEVELEAVWAKAYLVKGSNGGANAILNYGNLGVERNFMTLTDGQSYRFNGTTGRRITNVDRAVTISSYYPNGEAPAGTNNTITGNNNNITLGADTKFENVTLSAGSYTLTASGYDVIVGRGCTSTNVGTVRGMSDGSSSAVNYTIRLESGTFGTFALIDNTARTFSSTISTLAVFGSDYDRAKSDNSKLSIAASSTIYGGNAAHTFSGSANRNNITYDWLIKSGRVQGSTSVGDAAADKSIYIGNSISGSNANSIQYCGKRRLTMEGGEIASIAGSVNCYGNNYANYGVDDGTWSVMIRLKGGTVRGSIYGAAAYAGASGNRLFIMTGGTVNGWVAGGANGTQSDGGMMYGASSIYIGGNTSINSNSSTTVINRAVGGNVFGAGCGYGTSSNSGQVTAGTTVVVADDAYVERGVYGGGSYGYTTSTSNVYIMGGTVDCKAGGVNGTTYNANVNGGVYGGACQNRAGVNNVKVYGGTVNGGVYGGGNVSGDVAGPITVDVYGTDAQDGANYAVGAVYGGGNQANYSGTPNVNVHCGENISIEYVYGGGNAATVTGTNVTIEGGNKIGNVFGGCYGANVTTNGTKVNVKGGTIGKVFGGNNQSGAITGGIMVRVDKQSTCPMKIGELYGGGNVAASAVGSIDIGCTGDLTAAHANCNETDNRIGYELEGIGDVYGGANAAAVTGNVNLTIDSGMVYRVFGNNNTSASVSGTITVNIDKQNDACGWYVGHVYGGGNKAPYTAPNATPNHPAVNIKNGEVSYNVYGGALGTTAAVSGNPQVILSGTAEVGGNVYGGGNAAPVSGNTKVTLRD